MVHQATGLFCPEDKMSSLLSASGADLGKGVRELDPLLEEYPGDARLHFLKGSFLAGEGDFTGARLSMRMAVDLAPDYHVARFQLGFLLLTSGEPHAAQEAWGPLHGLPPGSYLHLFVKGLCHLIRDEFGEALKCLENGVAHNTENPAMNRDMQMIMEQIRGKPDGGAADSVPVSSVDFLLQQAALKPVRR